GKERPRWRLPSGAAGRRRRSRTRGFPDPVNPVPWPGVSEGPLLFRRTVTTADWPGGNGGGEPKPGPPGSPLEQKGATAPDRPRAVRRLPDTDGQFMDTTFPLCSQYAGTAHRPARTSRAGPSAGGGCLSLIMPPDGPAASVQPRPRTAVCQLAHD